MAHQIFFISFVCVIGLKRRRPSYQIQISIYSIDNTHVINDEIYLDCFTVKPTCLWFPPRHSGADLNRQDKLVQFCGRSVTQICRPPYVLHGVDWSMSMMSDLAKHS